MKSKSITVRDPWSTKPFEVTIEHGQIQAIAPGSADERAWEKFC
jgi:hypothetical protein